MHYRPLTPQDIYRLNRVNLDGLTENFGLQFYASYLVNWPDLCIAATAADGTVIGYTIGNVDVDSDNVWRGHLSAISIATEYRCRGIAQALMRMFEEKCRKYKCEYVDLFVRGDNEMAIQMYNGLGYITHREIPDYYREGDSALELRLDLH